LVKLIGELLLAVLERVLPGVVIDFVLLATAAVDGVRVPVIREDGVVAPATRDRVDARVARGPGPSSRASMTSLPVPPWK